MAASCPSESRRSRQRDKGQPPFSPVLNSSTDCRATIKLPPIDMPGDSDDDTPLDADDDRALDVPAPASGSSN